MHGYLRCPCQLSWSPVVVQQSLVCLLFYSLCTVCHTFMTVSIAVLAYLLARVTEMQERPIWPREGHITILLQDVESGDAIYEVCKLCVHYHREI